jgi:hypothetical protein
MFEVYPYEVSKNDNLKLIKSLKQSCWNHLTIDVEKVQIYGVKKQSLIQFGTFELRLRFLNQESLWCGFENTSQPKDTDEDETGKRHFPKQKNAQNCLQLLNRKEGKVFQLKVRLFQKETSHRLNPYLSSLKDCLFDYGLQNLFFRVQHNLAPLRNFSFSVWEAKKLFLCVCGVHKRWFGLIKLALQSKSFLSQNSTTLKLSDRTLMPKLSIKYEERMKDENSFKLKILWKRNDYLDA